nr:toll-like receptor 7 [Leptinotarsa decemlineata]
MTKRLNKTMKLHISLLILSLHLTVAEYIPPGPLYRCPKETLLLYPCTCDSESDNGITVSCNNTNLASMSIGLNNLATFRLPIEKLTIYKCHIGRLYGSLLYKLNLKVLHVEDTPVEIIEEHTFLGVNNTLNEFHLKNASLKEFPTLAFKILGNLTVLNLDGHKMAELPKDAFAGSNMTGTLFRLHITNGNLSTPPPESLQPLRRLKKLDLHGNRIKDLKRNQFKGLRDVEILDLSFNEIPKIDGSHLSDLTKLSFLNVSNNKLKEITRGAFARNTVLKVLNVSFNQIKKLDQNSFRGMRFLRRLYLSDNVISDIGRGTFESLKRIGTIDLARNLLKKIDYQMFYQLNFIEILDVSENQITEIQKLAFKDIFLARIILSKNKINKIENGAFENCANITFLDLSFNQLANLPKNAFDETTYATELQLSHNFFSNLSQIPLHNMTGIKILNVSHNFITTIPRKTFPKLYELHTIDLSYNNLTDIFNAVFQTLFSLRFIDMSHNNLVTIKPGAFGSLPTLLELDLSYNNLESVAKSAFARISGARKLTLRGNKLKDLFQLPISVSHLDLSHNEFERFPPEAWPSMNSLLSLDLSHNHFGDNLGQGNFANLLTLQRLNLNYNGVQHPPWVPLSDLTSLQYLYLEGNNLTKLERNAFGKLPVIFELNLANNNISNITSRAFEGLLQILVLNLTNNNLKYIPTGAFQGLVALQNLDLSHNKIVKMDNKTHGVLDDCLSLEKVDLSHNKISFLSRKFFPSNPYIPYKLRDVDLSYNLMPVLTADLTVGTSKVEKLNLSNNAIADIRTGVIGNLTRLRSLDLSNNKLYDLTSDKEFFRLPDNISELYLNGNILDDLPWKYLRDAKQLSVLDLRFNLFQRFVPELIEIVKNKVDVYFEENPLHCDCFLRPLTRYFRSQLFLKPFYKTVRCRGPSFLENHTLYDLPEERLNCPINVNTSMLIKQSAEDYDILSDLKFRELSQRKGVYKVKWRVMKESDIADTEVIIRDMMNAQNLVFKATIPYFKRSLEIDSNKNFRKEIKTGGYQICLLAKNSYNVINNFYEQQCKDLSMTISSAERVYSVTSTVYVFLLSVIVLNVFI